MSPRRTARLAAALALALSGCGGSEPRYGEVTISSAAPRARVSGTTFGRSAALELAPGCPGYLDLEQPGHVLHVTEDRPFRVEARSDEAPLALAVAHGDEVRCDSDEGSGHRPALDFEGGGDYQVYVAALREPASLSYELTVAMEGAGAAAAAPTDAGAEVSVTITSDPPGARIAGPDGEVVGVTPAIFVLHLPREELGQRRTWSLSLPGHRTVSVGGRLDAGALVLHAQLPPGPTEVDVTAAEAQPIRDHESASLAVEVAESCTITEASVGVDLRHTFIGDLRVLLRAPWGDELTLHRHGGGARQRLQRVWRSSQPPLRSLLGHDTRGRWTLVVHDDADGDQGTLQRFDLHLTCGAPGIASNVPPPALPPGGGRRLPRPVGRPTSALPDLPTRADIVRVLAALRPRVERCGAGSTGHSARVIATVAGSTGAVTQVSSSGSASPSERQCVERIVRTARFPRFRRRSLDVDYTFSLGRGAARRRSTRRRRPFRPQLLEPWL